MKKFDVCIVGGAGHIGLPLGLLLKSKNKRVVLYDKNTKIINKINSGIMPFIEKGANKLLKKNKEKIFATNNIKYIKNVKIVIVCIGTPITNNLKPNFKYFFRLFEELKSHLNKDQVIIIRSSIYPGSCRKIINILGKKFKHISYCPERILQGEALIELPILPQIISGYNKRGIDISKKLFNSITSKTIVTTVLEAEFIKLFSNAWRYINFAASNQFFMICQSFNLDFKKVRNFMMDGYDRNANLPKAGFAAGPCLVKDTIQLSHFVKNKFPMGIESLKINEGLPLYLIQNLKKNNQLKNKKIGILGLTFKSNVDDIRDSLSFKLIKILKKQMVKVLVSDEFYKHPDGITKKELIKKSDVIILAVPHKSYKGIKIPKNKIVIDTWGMTKRKY